MSRNRSILIIAVAVVSIGILLLIVNNPPKETANQAQPKNKPSSQETPVVSPLPTETLAETAAKTSPTETPAATAAKPESFEDGVWIKKYHGNFACYKFETPDGIKVITDPFCMDETIDPDIVTESHQHVDHTDVKKLTGIYELLTTTGESIQSGVKVTGVSGKHNKGDTECTNIIYVFEIEGITIAHFASQGELPDEKALEEMGNIDILLIQAFTSPDYKDSKLTLAECKEIIRKLKPKIVIPEHGTPKLGDSLAKYLEADIEYASNGQLVVTRDALDEIETVKIIDLDTNVTL